MIRMGGGGGSGKEVAIERVGSRPSRIRKEVQGRYSETGLGLEKKGVRGADKIVTVTSCLLLAWLSVLLGMEREGSIRLANFNV